MLPSKGFDTPFLESPDTLETQRTEHPFSFQTSKDKQLNAVIVDAINRMGGVGDEAEAREVLLKHAAHRTFSIRRACVQGLMQTGTDDDKRKLRRLLKERKEEGLLKIKQVDVRSVPQPIGGRFVVPPQVKSEAPPPDLRATRE